MSRVHSSRRTQASASSNQDFCPASPSSLLRALLCCTCCMLRCSAIEELYNESVSFLANMDCHVSHAAALCRQQCVPLAAPLLSLSHAPAHLEFHSFATSRSASVSTRVGELLSRILILMTAAKCFGEVRSGGIGQLDPS